MKVHIHLCAHFLLNPNIKHIHKGKDIPYWEISAHTVIQLLKMYIFELPDPLLTYARYDAFIEKAKNAKGMQRLLSCTGPLHIS